MMKIMKIMVGLVMALGVNPGESDRRVRGQGHQTAGPGHEGHREAWRRRFKTGDTIRKFANRSLELAQISQLLWAAGRHHQSPGQADRALR